MNYVRFKGKAAAESEKRATVLIPSALSLLPQPTKALSRLSGLFNAGLMTEVGLSSSLRLQTVPSAFLSQHGLFDYVCHLPQWEEKQWPNACLHVLSCLNICKFRTWCPAL